MTAKEKAEELVDKYYKTFGDGYLGQQHIQCALIAVDEIINDNPNIYDSDRLNYKYWNKVKQEIEKL